MSKVKHRQNNKLKLKLKLKVTSYLTHELFFHCSARYRSCLILLRYLSYFCFCISPQIIGCENTQEDREFFLL